MAFPPENEARLLTREAGHVPRVGEHATGLPIDLLMQSVSRLRVLALLYAFVFFMTIFPTLLLPQQRARMFGSFVGWGPGAISIAVALFVAALIRSARMPLSVKANVGLAFEVAASYGIAAAEFLISQRYTRSSSLAVRGRGAGGLLVGAAITQRPELFGAALIDAGILDMTRFSRFTIGTTWMPEFGSPDRPMDLRALLAYSPLQNVRPDVRYPPVLITVGDRDDAVTPAHSYKFAAALQGASTNSAAALLRVDSDVGFGPGVPTSKQVALDNDRLAFLIDALRVAR